MITHKIVLRPEEVKDFVAAAGKSSFDIDIYYNRYVVDAKSILGVLGLDLRKTLTVAINGYDPEFERFISRFAIAS
ncbi:MAG: HPr family phosphocarrier protein [Lachnospiraceae bacterium]|nr:HPr family phosphocarrier protein [Lachnospiraceae bacterium]